MLAPTALPLAAVRHKPPLPTFCMVTYVVSPGNVVGATQLDGDGQNQSWFVFPVHACIARLMQPGSALHRGVETAVMQKELFTAETMDVGYAAVGQILVAETPKPDAHVALAGTKSCASHADITHVMVPRATMMGS